MLMLSSVELFRQALPGLTETTTPEKRTQITQSIRPLMQTLAQGLRTMIPSQPNSWQQYDIGGVRSIMYIDKRNKMLLDVIPNFDNIFQISLPDDPNTYAQLTVRQEPRFVDHAYVRKPEDEIVRVAGQTVLTTPNILVWLSCPDFSGEHLLQADLSTETDAQWKLSKIIHGVQGKKEKHAVDYSPDPEDILALKKPWNLLFDTLGGIAVRVG